MRWKQWPIDRYRQVIERVIAQRPGAQVVLFGSASEQAMINEMSRGLKGRVLLAAGNLALFRWPVAWQGQFKLFDIGGAIGIAGMSAMLLLFTGRNIMRLYKLERTS